LSEVPEITQDLFMISKSIDLHNIKVHYLVGGQGRVLILLPSLFVTSKSYEILGEKLCRYFTVIIPDIYKGNSVFNSTTESLSDYTVTLKEFCDALKLDKLYLIGISASGLIATDYIQRYPKSVIKGMLFSTIVAPLISKFKFIRLAWGYLKLIIDYMKSWERLKVNWLWFKYAAGSVFRHPKQFILEAKQVVEFIPTKTDFKIPVKLIFAKHDEFLPKSVLADNQKLKQIEIEIYEGDHTWFFLKQDEFVNKVKKYFDG
jgi:pimeloyl-ACP methyl ester carboxylesterase